MLLKEHTAHLGEVSISERIYNFINNINKSTECLICNKKVNFRTYGKGYYTYCSTKCSMNDSKIHDKIINSRINNTSYNKNNELVFYNYIYLDPRKPGKYEYKNLDFCLLYEPFYVGKGKDKRYLSHIKNRNITNKDKLINQINNNYNIQNYILIFHNMTEDFAYKNERLLCRNIGIIDNNTGSLFNKSYGGLGGISRVISEEEKNEKKRKSLYEKSFI